MNRIRYAGVVIAVALGTVLAGIAGRGATAAAQGADTPFTRLRLVNATVDAPYLDVLIDGRLWIGGLNGVTGYSNLDPGEHSFAFRAMGSADDLAALRVTVAAGQRVTIAAINRADALEILALTDDVSAPARNAARVRVIHAAPDVAALRVSLGAKTLANRLAYARASAPRQFFDGAYDLTVTDGDGNPLITERDRVLTGNRAVTLFIVGDGTPEGWRIIAADSSVLKPDSTSQFRFAHMAADVGPVSVYVNNEAVPLYPTVPYTRVTHYFVTGVGEHRFDVYREGDGPVRGAPLASATAAVGANESLVFVAYGSGGEVKLTAFAGDLTPLAGGMTRFQVVHAAAGNPALTVERIEGAALFDSVGFLEAPARELPSGTYNIRFNDAATDALLMEKNGIALLPGTLTVLLAFDDDPASPFVNAVSFTTEYLPVQSAVRWVNLNTHLPPLDLYLNGERVAAGLEPGGATPYQLIAPRGYLLTVYAAGADPASQPPLISRRVEFGWADIARTVYLFGGAQTLLAEVAPDERTLLPGNKAQVRFIHVAENAGLIAVRDAATGDNVISTLGYGRASVWVPMEIGTQNIRFELPGGVLGPVQEVTLTPGSMVTVALGGDVPDVLAAYVFTYTP